MSISTLPLCYCTNVHVGRTLVEVESGLTQYAVPIAAEYGAPMSIGLWFSNNVARELAGDAAARQKFRRRLDELQLSCHTLNAFPYGDFHGERVKEQVYLPDWAAQERTDYTLQCAAILADLLPEGREGSISTLPLGFSPAVVSDDFNTRCIAQLIEVARKLDELHESSGRIIRIAIEPEPCCLIETTPEAIRFFQALWTQAEQEGALDVVKEHLGVCYDVCHQAVEFEDAAESIAALQQAGIRINKVQISCAIELQNPRENLAGREALAVFVEPRYLHQTFSRFPDGDVAWLPDLSQEFCLSPPEEMLKAELWRVHFHVPVNETEIGPLRTTRPDLETALQAVADLDYAPHLEVETYTWSVLPGAERPPIVSGIAQELRATAQLLAAATEGRK